MLSEINPTENQRSNVFFHKWKLEHNMGKKPVGEEIREQKDTGKMSEVDVGE